MSDDGFETLNKKLTWQLNSTQLSIECAGAEVNLCNILWYRVKYDSVIECSRVNGVHKQ